MKIRISEQELRSIGCINCVWKLHGQCPHGICSTDDTIYEFDEPIKNTTKDNSEQQEQLKTSPAQADSSSSIKGYCKEYIEFILSFADDDDSVNTLWEKFSLYMARIQSLDDYSEFIKLKNDIEANKDSMNYKEQAQYDIKLNNLRLWWERLNDTVRKGYGRIADRESKAKEGTKLPGIMNAKTINFNLENKPSKQLEHEGEKK